MQVVAQTLQLGPGKIQVFEVGNRLQETDFVAEGFLCLLLNDFCVLVPTYLKDNAVCQSYSAVKTGSCLVHVDHDRLTEGAPWWQSAEHSLEWLEVFVSVSDQTTCLLV